MSGRCLYSVFKFSGVNIKLWFFSFIISFVTLSSSAQNLHERIWYFGTSLQFNNGVSSPYNMPTPGANGLYPVRGTGSQVSRLSLAVSDTTGNLQFFTYIRSGTAQYTNHSPKVFDRNGHPLPNGNIESNRNGDVGHDINPIAVPYPGQPHKYFLFYSNNFSLMYSVVNMQLNNGMGDIEPGQKDVKLTGYGTIESLKITTVKGCNNNIWLITRSRIANEYLSFGITSQGIDHNPIVSVCGSFSLYDYWVVTFSNGLKMTAGNLRASNSGRLLAVGTNRGIELYDFEPCSGRLKNARIIDSLRAYGLCFSPDDSKLYATHNKYFWTTVPQGEVFQYDMRSGHPASIAASRTLVMRNPIYETWTPLGPIYTSGYLGELKIGLDGKMYVSKNLSAKGKDSSIYCNIYYPGPDHDPVPLPASNYCRKGQFMQVIHEPNRLGMACGPEFEYLKLTDDDDFHRPGLLLQSDIKIAPVQPPDTIRGNKAEITVCFRKEEILIANADGACYTWDDGSTEQTRTINASGTYWVSYFKDCSHQTDTFEVTFIPLPEVPQLVYGCPGEIELAIKNRDTTLMIYTLEKENSGLSYTAESSQGYTFNGLSAGDYALRIQSHGGCDTTLHIHLEDYPSPEVTVSPADTIIRYGDTLQVLAEGAQSYVWHPFAAVSQPHIPNPITFPLQPAQLFVVGTNAYGCRDTGYVNINIDYTMPDMIPNAFSPNGDGLNDVFKIEGITYQQIIAFKVFNRFGQLVFSTTDPDKGKGCCLLPAAVARCIGLNGWWTYLNCYCQSRCYPA